MHRRPWPLIALAVLFVLSPLFYPLFVALFFDTPFGQVLADEFRANSALRNFEVFALPPLMGLGTYLARRPGYFIVLFGSLYLMGRGFFIFLSEDEAPPIATVAMMIAFFGIVVFYFSRRKTRALYFDSKMRWWETDPRYEIDLAGRVLRGAGEPLPMRIRNIAIGGAALEGALAPFAEREIVHVDFEWEGKPFRLAASVVWERAQDSKRTIGVQWMEDPGANDYDNVRALVAELKRRRTPKTNGPTWWEEIRGWLARPPETD